MPRINDYILDSVFYLYKTEHDAREGTGGGGCGVFVRYPFITVIDGKTGIHVYAITNRHIVKEMKGEDQKLFIRVNMIDGDIDFLEIEPHSWVFHDLGHDLAICPVPVVFGKHRVEVFPHNQLLKESNVEEIDLGVGSEIVTFGRFKTHEGKQQNIPVARFGYISMMPIEPIYNKYLQINQESFLVECHSASGYSGSPVTVTVGLTRHEPEIPSPGKSTKIIHEGRTFLIGIVWAHMDEYTRVVDKQDNVINDEWYVKYNTGMMAVVPAWRIIELLESDELAQKRQQIEKIAVDKY